MRKYWIPGTLVWRKDKYMGLVDHYGVVVGRDLIAHIDKTSAGYLDVRIESFEVFARGAFVHADPRIVAVPLDQMWTRIEQVVRAKRPYGLLCWGREWNCESFARYVRDGIARSTQADAANALFTICAIAACFVVVVSLAKEA